jgi:hypothetical protein
MAKKSVRPDKPASTAEPARRRAPSTPKRSASTSASTTEPVGMETASLDTANDMKVQGDVDSAETGAPSYEEIAEAAYRRYLERGGEHGRDFDDWLEAERTLRSRR